MKNRIEKYFRECGEEIHWVFKGITSGRFPGGIVHWNAQGISAEGIDEYIKELGEERDEKGAHVCSILFMSRSGKAIIGVGNAPIIKKNGNCIVVSFEGTTDSCCRTPIRVIHIPSGLAEDGYNNDYLAYDDEYFENMLNDFDDEEFEE